METTNRDTCLPSAGRPNPIKVSGARPRDAYPLSSVAHAARGVFRRLAARGLFEEPISLSWRHLPQPARDIAEAAVEAVAAAGEHDPEAFQQAVGRLGALDAEQVGRVLGAVVRLLLEDMHPDGLTADDVRMTVDRCVRSAAGWTDDVDTDLLVMLIAGALGVHQAESFPIEPARMARHAPLLVADLLAACGHPLTPVLRAAFADIEHAELSDTP
jgi:hypothetical protein